MKPEQDARLNGAFELLDRAVSAVADVPDQGAQAPIRFALECAKLCLGAAMSLVRFAVQPHGQDWMGSVTYVVANLVQNLSVKLAAAKKDQIAIATPAGPHEHGAISKHGCALTDM